MTKYILNLFIISVFLFLGACASSDEVIDDESVIEEITEAASDDSATQEAEEFGDDEVSEEAAQDEVAQEEPAQEQQAEPAEEGFDEEEAVAQEEPAEPAPEEPMAEEPLEQANVEEPVEPAAEEQEPLNQSANSTQNKVTAINYLSSANGGTIEIKTSVQATYNVRPNADTNQYIIEIQNALLADSLKRPYIMKDFEGAFGAINAYQNSGASTSRIVVQLKGGGEPVISQEGNTILVMPPGESGGAAVTTAVAEPVPEVTPEADTDAESYDTKNAAESEKVLSARTLDEFLTGSGKFFGRPISIQTNDADIRDVISFIAEESGVNLVISDDVDGKVSVKLRQVPWDQALVIVMRSRGLGYVRQGNVLRITKLSSLQAEATTAKEIVESQKKLTPLKVKVLPISFANVADLATQIKPFLSIERGQVVSDSRTSTVIITDTAEVLMRVERLVKELDIPPAQVMIEGKIVEASETFTRRVGVNWSLSGSPFEVSPAGGINGSALTLRPSLNVANFASNQAGNGALSLRMGTMDFLGNLEASLSLAQADALVKIISSPRIVTMNKEKSLISQKGEVITIQSTKDQSNNTISTATRSAVELKLEVTPQITAEGSVVLDVNVLRQFPGAETDATTKARPINSREAKTKVLVPNGQTAVIGGIYQSDETETENGVPVLKDIPVLGWLFKQKSQERAKNELLLFLTPRILNAKDQTVTN